MECSKMKKVDYWMSVKDNSKFCKKKSSQAKRTPSGSENNGSYWQVYVVHRKPCCGKKQKMWHQSTDRNREVVVCSGLSLISLK